MKLPVLNATQSVSYRRFFWLTLAIFCMPLFPPIFESSHVHINTMLVGFSTIVAIFNWNSAFDKYNTAFFVYLFALQALLIINFVVNGASQVQVGDVPSLFRPVMLCMTFLMVLFFLERDVEFNDQFLKVFKVFIIISVLYFFVEIFFVEKFSQLVYGLYKRESRPDLRFVFTSFFGTSYYAGFVYFTVLIFLLPNFFMKKSLGNFCLVFFCIFFVLLNQSKLILFTLALYLFIIFFIRQGWFGKLMTLLVCSFILFGSLSLLSDTQLTSGLKVSSLSSLRTLIFDPQSSGTLNVRIFQITSILQQEAFLGMGLGRDAELESWLATYLYRYGVLGAVSFLIFHLSLALTLIFLGKHAPMSNREKIFITSISIWFFLLPISQMSSAMIEGSKFSYLYALMCAIALSKVAHHRKSFTRGC